MKTKKIIFATTNEGKIREATDILRVPVEPLKIELDEIQSLDFKEVIEHKAKQAYEKTGEPVLVEDSGIIFNGLGKLPGVFTKWFSKSLDNDGMVKLLEAFENKEATAVSYVGYYDGKNMIVEYGETKGRVVAPRGSEGFGWDPIFEPAGHTKTFAEMDFETKNSLSMRKFALMNFLQAIEEKENGGEPKGILR